MTLVIRALGAEDGSKAAELLREPHERPVYDLSQDRGSDFFAVGRHASRGRGEPKFWGAFSGEELLAVSGFVETPVTWPDEGATLFLQDESYVHPDHRGSFLFPRLMARQLEFFRRFAGIPVAYGLEGRKDALTGIDRLLSRFGAEIRFVAVSVLSQVHVRAISPKGGGEKILRIPLAAFGEEEFRKFFEYFQERELALFPRVTGDMIPALLTVDPAAHALVYDDGSRWTAGLVVMNPSRLRRFRYSARRRKLISAIRSASGRGEPEAEGDIAIQNWCLHWHRDSAAMTRLLLEAQRLAHAAGFDIANIRDAEASAVPPSFRPGVLTYPSRVFVAFRREDAERVKDSFKGSLEWRPDPAFL